MKKIFFLLITVQLIAITTIAQFDLKNAIFGGGSLFSSILKKPPPITTSFSDVDMQGFLPDSFGNSSTYLPLYQMSLAEKGGYVICPGYYEMTNMSYCVKAGTYNPNIGEGFMYAPLKGKLDDVVESVLAGHAKHPEVPQQDVQMLLWAIISRAKFKDLSGRMKLVTALLLSPKQIVKLNGGVLEIMGREALNHGLVNVPPIVQKAMDAENSIRSLVQNGTDRYEDFEQYAVLAGMATNDHPEIRRGMWTLHPDGYYIRYFPDGYAKTKVQVYVPENVGQVTFNAVGMVACPANTGAQRLAQTNMPVNRNALPVTNPCLQH